MMTKKVPKIPTLIEVLNRLIKSDVTGVNHILRSLTDEELELVLNHPDADGKVKALATNEVGRRANLKNPKAIGVVATRSKPKR